MNKIEKHHRLAVVCNQKGEKFKWVTCLHVSKVVGSGGDGATVALANDMAVSVDSLEKYAMAYKMYDCIRRYPVRSDQFHSMLEVRNRLSIKHFWTISQLWRRYEFDPTELVDYLVTAAEYGTSVETMRTAIVGANETDYKNGWKQLLARSVTNLLKVTEDYSVPLEIRDLTNVYLQDVGEVLQAMENENASNTD